MPRLSQRLPARAPTATSRLSQAQTEAAAVGGFGSDSTLLADDMVAPFGKVLGLPSALYADPGCPVIPSTPSRSGPRPPAVPPAGRSNAGPATASPSCRVAA